MENEELNWRRQERERRRQQRKEDDRKLKMKLLIAAAVLVVSVLSIVLLASSVANSGSRDSARQTKKEERATEKPAEKIVGVKDGETVIHIKAVGDLNVTDSVILAGARSTGYDFTACFMDVAPILADADLTVESRLHLHRLEQEL